MISIQFFLIFEKSDGIVIRNSGSKAAKQLWMEQTTADDSMVATFFTGCLLAATVQLLLP